MLRAGGPRQTIVPLIIGTVALAVIVAMTFWLNQRAGENFRSVKLDRILRSAAVELRSNIQGAESSQRGYLYTGNEIYLAPYGVAKAQITKQEQIVQAGLTRYPELQAAAVRLNEVVLEKLKEMDESIDVKRKGRDTEALDLVQTNRGKALTDEANVFLSGVIRTTEHQVLAREQQQQQSVSFLRWVSIAGALVILTMVVLGAYFVLNHMRSLSAAQAEVRQLNQGLEARVQERTAELAQANDALRLARDRAEVLLAEVNHRVANSLAMVSTLVKLQANSVSDKAAKIALAETQSRIHAVSLVHRKLYTSGDVKVVSLDDYLAGIIEHLQSSMQTKAHGILLEYEFDHITLPADQSTNLGVILNEWVSNAVKYAYPAGSGAVRAHLILKDNHVAEMTVTDEGIGFDPAAQTKGTGFGTRIVKAMATSLAGTVDYASGNPGAIARLEFPVPQDLNQGHQSI